MTTPREDSHTDQPKRTARIGVGRAVVLAMSVGWIVALLVLMAPFIPSRENVLIGALLLSSALAWALLAILSARFTDQPQRWPIALASFMAVAGLVALSGAAHPAVRWVWPPILFGLVVWSIVQAKRKLHSRSRRWVIYPALIILAVASLGGGYEVVRENLDAKAYPAPGRLIDVGGHRLHLQCAGTGSPTVVIEAGGGASSADLGWIYPAVARQTRVCVYDRAGRGWSDPSDGPQDGAQIAADLHELLDKAHEPGPYVLAGHSFGGLYVMRFAADYPDQVAGMVLLDSTAPEDGSPPPTPKQLDGVTGRIAALVPAIAYIGGGRLNVAGSYDDLPPRYRDEANAKSATAPSIRASIEEYAIANIFIQQASALKTLGDKPLIVLTAEKDKTDPEWPEKQNRLAELSSNSSHRHADASHSSLVFDEKDSKAAIAAIHDLVESVRTSRPISEY